jgi:hypothetical protein
MEIERKEERKGDALEGFWHRICKLFGFTYLK